MKSLNNCKTKEEIVEEINRRSQIVLNYYGFETPFQRQQFFNCHEEMKKLESQASFHRTRIEKKVKG